MEKSQLTVAEYSAGDYFPKEMLTECLPFSIIADSPCEVISLPKRCLRALEWGMSGQGFRGEEYYRGELLRQKEWESFKQGYLGASLHFKEGKHKGMAF